MLKVFANDVDVWCISLADRADRYDAAVAEFTRIGLAPTFYRPSRDIRGGVIGCSESHRHCILSSRSRGNHALVFEDDVSFNENFVDRFIDEVNAFLVNDDVWDIFRLGTIVTYYTKSYNSSIWGCKSHSSHALIYNKNMPLNFIQNQQKSIDQVIFDSDLREFTHVKQMCTQRPVASDISWGDNTLQCIMEHPNVFEPLQNINNTWLFTIKHVPRLIQQYTGPWYLMSCVGKAISNVHTLVDYLCIPRLSRESPPQAESQAIPEEIPENIQNVPTVPVTVVFPELPGDAEPK
jgi:GR25 family glycosyltransferase involved in LPS biosynthesis